MRSSSSGSSSRRTPTTRLEEEPLRALRVRLERGRRRTGARTPRGRPEARAPAADSTPSCGPYAERPVRVLGGAHAVVARQPPAQERHAERRAVLQQRAHVADLGQRVARRRRPSGGRRGRRRPCSAGHALEVVRARPGCPATRAAASSRNVDGSTGRVSPSCVRGTLSCSARSAASVATANCSGSGSRPAARSGSDQPRRAFSSRALVVEQQRVLARRRREPALGDADDRDRREAQVAHRVGVEHATPRTPNAPARASRTSAARSPSIAATTASRKRSNGSASESESSAASPSSASTTGPASAT